MIDVAVVDVGQGAACVLALGRNRGIVIDAGTKEQYPKLLATLLRLQIQYLVCLAVSHNDNDHVGAATLLLNEYRGRIGRIGVVKDPKLIDSEFFDSLTEQIDYYKVLQSDQIFRLESQDRPTRIYADSARHITVDVWTPTFWENEQALGKGNANATSAVICLTVGTKAKRTRAVFSGDSEMRQWEAIHQRFGRQRIAVDLMAVTHHGGGEPNLNPQQVERLYSEIIKPKFAVISVGTENQHGHPCEDVVQAIRTRANGTVICTQITSQCHPNVQSLLPGVLKPVVGPTGRTKGVPCFGTILATFEPERVHIVRLEKHQEAVDKLGESVVKPPLCRR